ncbi:MAG: YidC/Oxa1 family membrane protein insertase [Peptostreptococcales bacterium]
MQALTSLIAKPLGQLLIFLYGFIGNYGVTIIVFTIVIKFIMIPLTVHQLKSSKKMQEIQPKIQEIQKKYANNKEMMNQKTMELYKNAEINPLGGCLPLLIQMPIILGLFALLRTPQDYITDPGFLQVLHDSFLWVTDLSQPDKWILPILAGVTTYFSFSMTGSGMESNPSMKTMKYIFPVMILWMARSMPAGLSLYWFVSTLFQIGQQFFMNKAGKKEA